MPQPKETECIEIGKFVLYKQDGKLWIVGDGDAGTFPEKDIEAVIQQFFDKHF